jgi:aspartyl-tRNA synthetase
MKNTSQYTTSLRTHNLGELRDSDIAKKVTLSGWVHKRRDHGNLIFVDLRDRYGLTQLVFDPEISSSSHSQAEALRSEWNIGIKGYVRARGEGLTNPKLKTGKIEIAVEEITIYSSAKTPPFSIADDTSQVNEDLRLTYRYLEMRKGELLENLKLRHKLTLATRQFLDNEHFIEIETPILTKSTPEGARDYIVPSRVHPSKFYALPQSPQIYKQITMIGGVDRYFQICKCFRDEDLRADRQPEFTQIDCEMSFVKQEDILELMEKLIQKQFKTCLNQDISTPFAIMSHADAMQNYGTDRPDTRFGMLLKDISAVAKKSDFSVFKNQLEIGGVIKMICVPGGSTLSRRQIDEYTKFVSDFGLKGLAYMKMNEDGLNSNIIKFFNDECQAELISLSGAKLGDLLLFAADKKEVVNQALDHLRRKLADDLNLYKKDDLNFLWITDFPLFNIDKETQGYTSEHHPFTMPHPQDLEYLETDPLKVRSLSHDIVLNGYEIGGGSIRIHDQKMQHKIFEILGLSTNEIQDKFGFLLEALSFGTPPHGGIAFGLDRIAMIMSNSPSIKEVIAFPKTQKGQDQMMRCPSSVDKQQLEELNIKTIKPINI